MGDVSWSSEASQHLASLLGGADIERVDELNSGPRATVHRAHRRGAPPVIVKWFNGGGEGWVRESAALSMLGGRAGLPQLLVGSGDPPVVVMSDLGDAPSLADALLGNDPAAADAALVLWAQAIAELHSATHRLRAEFQLELTARAGDLPVYDTRLGTDLDDAARVLDRECGALGVSVPAGAFDELRGLGERLGGDDVAALTPADACPDNNLVRSDRLTLLDFENAQWRHVAWDVAYLSVPWPTCWCAWQLPQQASQRAIDAYVAAARPALPLVAAASFGTDVQMATVAWTVLSLAWFLGASRDDQRLYGGSAPARPGKREVMLHRLRRAVPDDARAQLPALSELVQHLAADLTSRWDTPPLDLAPAYR